MLVGIVGALLSLIGVLIPVFGAIKFTRGKRPANRSKPKGAWERVARLERLGDPSSPLMAEAVGAAVRADAKKQMKSSLVWPTVLGVIMLLVGIAALYAGIWWQVAVSTVLVLLYSGIILSYSLTNDSRSRVIDQMIGVELESLLIRDPRRAIDTYKKTLDAEAIMAEWAKQDPNTISDVIAFKVAMQVAKRQLQIRAEQKRLSRLSDKLEMQAAEQRALDESSKAPTAGDESQTQRGADHDGTAGRQAATAAE